MSNENAKQFGRLVWRQHAVVGISLFFAVVLAVAGFLKLIGLPMMVEQFEQWLYPRWFVHFTGALELTAAGMIAFGKTRRYGASLVMAVMFGAIITHLKFDYSRTPAVLPLFLFLGAWYVNWEMRQELRQRENASSQ